MTHVRTVYRGTICDANQIIDTHTHAKVCLDESLVRDDGEAIFCLLFRIVANRASTYGKMHTLRFHAEGIYPRKRSTESTIQDKTLSILNYLPNLQYHTPSPLPNVRHHTHAADTSHQRQRPRNGTTRLRRKRAKKKNGREYEPDTQNGAP